MEENLLHPEFSFLFCDTASLQRDFFSGGAAANCVLKNAYASEIKA